MPSGVQRDLASRTPRGFPLSGFRLYDQLAVIESVAGEQQLASDDDIGLYTRLLDLLHDDAAHGPSATSIIRRVLTTSQQGQDGG